MCYWVRRAFDFVVGTAVLTWCYHVGGLLLTICVALLCLWNYFDGLLDGTP